MIKKLKLIFWSLVVIFVLLVGFFVGQASWDWKREMFLVVAVLAGIFLILGILLIILTLKQKIKGKLKWFLLMTGSSATMFLISVILHNLFYAAGVAFAHIMEGLSVVFFIIAVPICPIVFLVGAIGSIKTSPRGIV